MTIRSFYHAVLFCACLLTVACVQPVDSSDCADCPTDDVTDDVNVDPFDGPGIPINVTKLGEIEDCQINVSSDWFGADKICESDSMCALNPTGDWTFMAGHMGDSTPEDLPIHMDEDGYRWINTPVVLDSLEGVEEVELKLFPYYGTEPGGTALCNSFQNGQPSMETVEQDVYVDSRGHLKLPKMLGHTDWVVFHTDGNVDLGDSIWSESGYSIDHDATVLEPDFFSVTITDGIWPYTYACQF